MRGVRQGDPLSSFLFMTVMHFVFAELKPSWAKRRLGLSIGCENDERALTHLVYADDMTVLARSKVALGVMLGELVGKLRRYGLRLNTSKCKVQSTEIVHADVVVGGKACLTCGGVSLEVVAPDVGFKVLGTQWTLVGGIREEFSKRIGKAWSAFYAIWPLLKRRGTSLKKRLRVFDSSVTPVVLWCAQTWTLTSDQKRRLSTTQRDMLRRFAGPRRRAEENWVSWVRRATWAAEAHAVESGVKPWVGEHLKLKHQWAGHVARMKGSMWAHRCTRWRDKAWQRQQAHVRAMRVCVRRWTRWEDDLVGFAEHSGWVDWSEAAQLRVMWKEHCDDFVRFVWP